MLQSFLWLAVMAVTNFIIAGIDYEPANHSFLRTGFVMITAIGVWVTLVWFLIRVGMWAIPIMMGGK